MKMKETMQKQTNPTVSHRQKSKERKREKSTLLTKMYKYVPQHLIKYIVFIWRVSTESPT